MYTSCPECGTVFRISTTELRVAEGHVRCGHCSATFNAIATLSEEPPPSNPPVTTPERPSAAVKRTTQVGVEAATLGDDDTLEFNIPENKWSHFFGDDASARPPEPPAPDVGDDIGSATVDQAGLYRALSADTNGINVDDDDDWQALLEEVQDDDAPDEVYVIETDAPPDAPTDAPPDAPPDSPPGSPPGLPAEWPWDEPAMDSTGTHAPLPVDFAVDLARDQTDAGTDVRGGDVSDDDDQTAPGVPDGLAADRPFVWTPPVPAATVEPGRRWVYTASSALLALALLIQVIHQRRDELATNPSFTAPLQRVYGALGIPLWPAWDIRAYEVRNYEAVADRSNRGALDILARIAVVGKDPVGLPLVRVTLSDRFGEPLGSRVFGPAEYLRNTPPPREPLNPGTLIPVEISLKDPGNDAQGFDVDICLMSQRDGITCQSEREPFAR